MQKSMHKSSFFCINVCFMHWNLRGLQPLWCNLGGKIPFFKVCQGKATVWVIVVWKNSLVLQQRGNFFSSQKEWALYSTELIRKINIFCLNFGVYFILVGDIYLLLFKKAFFIFAWGNTYLFFENFAKIIEIGKSSFRWNFCDGKVFF